MSNNRAIQLTDLKTLSGRLQKSLLGVERKEYLYWGMEELKNRSMLPIVPEPQ